MISNTYAKAYTEVLEIIKYFPPEEYEKIPSDKIEFYKKNMDNNYIFSINPKIDLEKQNISKEANAIIVTLFRDYFATEEQKIKLKKILDINQNKEEENKKKKYNPDNLFKSENKTESTNIELQENNANLVEYKETFFIRVKKFIFKILHINE